ncbi:PH domain-containing protein [Umezawaea sp. Da 62-37]|uniref:PH domain-containing protein n=1 Tax=Umezawaea sp. Da 62-37 TaxID=3075927 RepID=UPI0028F6D203|nr:PH domain-containing protein [Umezawaea sp. Da 62-37]WNV89997.1 PH domain-containing protein [Umezawaea sp. Da 62-37]
MRLTGATMSDVDKLVFRIPAVALLASGVGIICVTPVAFAVPGLQVLYVLPLVFAVWVLRNRTTVDSEKIVARGVFGKRVVPWTDVKAIKLTERSWLSAVLTDDKLVKLPAVRMMHLPALAAVSGGRIADPSVKAVKAEEPVEVAESAEVVEAAEAATVVEDAAPDAVEPDVTAVEPAVEPVAAPENADQQPPTTSSRVSD